MANNHVYQPLLMDTDLERLDDFFESDRAPADALDTLGAHGFLVALAVAPVELSATHWIGELFQGEPSFASEGEREEIIALLETLKTNAAQALELGQLPELPFELTLEGLAAEETPIGDWCAGFMEGVFLEEAAWFAQDEENVAALLLPFMALSGLFDEEPDMQDFIADAQRLEALVGQLPDLTLDLYLHYRVPPEKPKPTLRKKRPARKYQDKH